MPGGFGQIWKISKIFRAKHPGHRGYIAQNEPTGPKKATELVSVQSRCLPEPKKGMGGALLRFQMAE